MMRRASWASACSLAVALFSGEASASEGYPAALREDLALGYAPACTLCHAGADDAGMPAADTPFARSMMARGLLGGDDLASLASALSAMRRDDTDSDGDGATDLDELSWGGDPNTPDLPAGTSEESAEPRYGCAVSPETSPRESPRAFVGLLMAAAYVAVRRKARRKIASDLPMRRR